MDRYKVDSQKIAYFPERIARWRENRDNWEKLKTIYPIYMEVSPSGGCNHRCIFCALDFLGYEANFLNVDKYFDFLEIASQKGVKSVMFGGEGEPLLHPQIGKMMVQTKRKGIDVALTTNGSLMTPKFLEETLEYINWIKVSLDAATPGSHAKIHGISEKEYHKIIDNIEYSVQLKKKNNCMCSIGIQLLLLSENKEEVVTLAQNAKSLGVDYFVVKPYSQGLYSKKSVNVDYEGLESIKNELDKLTDDNFDAVFRRRAFDTAVENENNYQQCHAVPFFWAYIMANGDVYSCSAFLGNDKFLLGNINKEPFDRIWEGQRRKSNWEFIKKMPIKECRENCRMDKINTYLEDIINPPYNFTFI